MDVQTWRVTAEQDGWRLDKVVATLERVGSRARARKVVESGKVTVDGRVVGPGDLGLPVRKGCSVAVNWTAKGTAFERHVARKGLSAAGLKILYEDDAIVAVDKPAGLLSDSATRQQRDEDTVRSRVHAWLKSAGGKAWVVHRIDRDTTGVVLLAKNETSEKHLRAQFRTHTPERVYRTVVYGLVAGPHGEWADWMAWDSKKLIQRSVRSDHPDGVLARATWKVLERFARTTLLEVRLFTGRRNQIRLHAQLAGHPLVGERVYLPEEFAAPRATRFDRQALHAAHLAVDHPVTGKRIAFDSPDPPDFAELIARLRRG